MSSAPLRRAWDGRTLEQELLDLEDWRPLNDEECQAWRAGELGPAPDGQLFGLSPCGIAVVYRERSLEEAVVALHSVGAHGLLVALLDSAEANLLHGAARLDVCIALGDQARALRALEEEAPWAREYVLDDRLRPWTRPAVWQWAQDVARIVAARQAAVAAMCGEEGLGTEC